MKLIVVAGVVALFVAWGVSSVVHYLDFHARVTRCADRIDPVPPEKWHGGNAPRVPSRAGCP